MVNLCLFKYEKTPQDTVKRVVKNISDKIPDCINKIEIYLNEIAIPENAFDHNRQQYLAGPFLETLKEFVPTKTHGLALVNLDLFVPRLNFIFGLAEFGGNALVALPRLSPTFYGLPENQKLYDERVVKEALHELGHVLGLHHCHNRCVMRFSNSLSDTDRKPDEYCPSCLSKLS